MTVAIVSDTCHYLPRELVAEHGIQVVSLYVHRDDQVRGLTHLLTLALRVLTLFEVLVRRGQDQDGADLAGLYPGQPKRTTDRPTAKRVLETIAGAGLTLTRVGSGEGCRRSRANRRIRKGISGRS